MNVIICGHTFSFLLDIYLGGYLLSHIVTQCLNFSSVWGNSHIHWLLFICSFCPFLSFPLGLPKCICINNLGFHQMKRFFPSRIPSVGNDKGCFPKVDAAPCILTAACAGSHFSTSSPTLSIHSSSPQWPIPTTPLPPQPSHFSQHANSIPNYFTRSISSWICPGA